MKALIAGTSLINSRLFENWAEESVETPYGIVTVRRASQYLFLQRHGKKLAPPHRINHHANIWALKSRSVEGVIAVNSVGSLKFNLKPGTFLIPHDFFSPWDIPTFFDNESHYTIPVMDMDYAERMGKITTELEMDTIMGGIYVQTRGPRFETRAEVEALKKVGDVVGMTMGSEATLCMEYAIPYVSLCSIDNYCNGIVKTPLAFEEVEENITRNIKNVELVIQTILGEGF
jgi:purine nucleoside phosphorylase